MKPNPIPALRTYFGVKVPHIAPFFPPGTPLEQIHAAFTHGLIDDKLHAALFDMVMDCWGRSDDLEAKQALWECYFPDTRPHILHKLVYEHFKFDQIVRATTITPRMLRRYLRQPKLHQYQLRKVGRYALQYIDELSSKNRLRGPDPRYVELSYALRDPKRLYAKGEIVTD